MRATCGGAPRTAPSATSIMATGTASAGRNWGNNEYDFAHCFFMQFARTGNRDYFRVALRGRAAPGRRGLHPRLSRPLLRRRQPAPLHRPHRQLVGTAAARHLEPRLRRHGRRQQRPHLDHRHGRCLAPCRRRAGDGRGLGVGEHITWAMSRDFKTLGTHERSAGWSLKAILSLYRSTYDPLYLEAARRIAAVALGEQKFNDGGAWPHPLPEDHAGGHAMRGATPSSSSASCWKGSRSSTRRRTIRPSPARSSRAPAGC